LKIWGTITENGVEMTDRIRISAQCLRVPVSDGHTAAIFVKFRKKPPNQRNINCG
jgi:aspartate-semialdehyde dehydrogenase